MLPGETVGFGGVTCGGDGDHDPVRLKLEVCHSAAGYYLGYNCPFCGPYSRETGYFKTRGEAEKALASPLKARYMRA